MANDNHLFPVPCYNGTMLKQDYYNDFFDFGQQKINFSFFELHLPDDDPVYTLKKVMEELDFSGLLACCSDQGRTGYNPIMLYAVVTYANMRGIRAVDRIVELCERDLAFIWLTKGQRPRRDAFYDFKGKKLTGEILDELNYQFLRRLKKEGLLTLRELFIDGTKIEANANRYTFVWRGSLNYHLAGLLDTIDALYAAYNALLHENGYGPKYDLGDARMFVVEGMDKVRRVIEENRKRKLTKHKKISNNTVIEIDGCSPPEILKLQKNLKTIAEGEGIGFVYGKGQRKPEIQKLYEELETCGSRLMEYKEHFEIMGKGRNSYSKTDLEATFMRMKEDAMLNGQLKPAYNIQHGVDSEYITWIDISPHPTDTRTLIPFLKDMENHLGFKYSEVVADAGYESEENYLFIEENGQTAYIKPQNYEISKTRKYKKDISRRENMEYHADRDSYICLNGRELTVTNERRSKTTSGYVSVKTYYRSPDCTGCPYKTECIKGNNCKTPMEKRNKVLMVSKTMSQKRAEDLERITSEYGTMLRMNRSIQAEGSFADVKEDMNFRRYLYRGKANALAESILLAMGRNINKLHCKIQTGRTGSHLFSLKTA